MQLTIPGPCRQGVPRRGRHASRGSKANEAYLKRIGEGAMPHEAPALPLLVCAAGLGSSLSSNTPLLPMHNAAAVCLLQQRLCCRMVLMLTYIMAQVMPLPIAATGIVITVRQVIH